MIPSRSIRLAYLISRYPAISHTFILREVLGLRERGFDIHVSSINLPDRPTSRLTAEERAEAERTFYVKAAGLPGAARAHVAMLIASPLRYLRGLACAIHLGGLDAWRLTRHLFYFVEAVILARMMRERALTHLHVHFATPAASVALIVTRLLPVSLSMTVHGPDEFSDVSRYRLREKVLGCEFVVCISAYARSQLMTIVPPEGWERLELAPLGVDPRRFVPGPPPRVAPPFELLCVGRLVPAKGQAILISAMERLVRASRSVHLTLVGDGPDREGLTALVTALGLEAHVTFAGAVNQDEIRPFYRRAHVFVLASFAEGVPVVLMEAMAMEIPVVATRITGIPELIRSGVDGVLVTASDAGELAEAITRLIDAPAERARLAAAGRARVIDRYHFFRNTDHLADIFRRRLETAPAARAALQTETAHVQLTR